MHSAPPVRKPWFLTVALALIFAIAGSGATIAAQESSLPTDAPVDIHSGTCSDIIAEPAYDGGQLAMTNTADIWEEESFQAGIFNDDQLQATGLDFNSDGELQAEEVITPNGIDTDLVSAQGDLEGEVNTDEPYVVAVHASPDAYDTIIACGSIQAAQESDGQTIIHLQPTGDSTLFGFAVLGEDNTSLTTYLFTPNTEPIQGSTPVSEQLEIVGHPVEIHSGVCEDFTSEPVYDIGDFQQTNAYAEGQQDAGDMEGQVPAEAENLGPVYKLTADEADFGDQSILDQGPHVVAVHQSAEDFGNVIACGQILPVMDDDNVVVFLHPVGGTNQVGYIEMGQDGGEANGFLWEMEDYAIQEAVEATPVDAGTPAPIATQPEATPTEEATAVIVETQVVPAEEATAIAEEEATEESTPEGETGQTEAVPVSIGGDTGTAVTASANQTLMISNESENERTFSVQDLGLEATVGGGEQTELLVPEEAEAGTYSYQVMEDDSVVFEGEMAVE